MQDQMVQDSLTLHPQILAAKYSLDQLQEQHRQGNLTTYQVSILDALRQGRVDHHVDALGRDAFARIGEDDMTPKEFDAHFAGMMLPSTERALRAMMNNPALNTREAKAAEPRIAAFAATADTNATGSTALLNALQNKARTGQAVAMFRDLFTNQGMSMEQARNQAIVQHSPLFDDTAAPPDSLRAVDSLSPGIAKGGACC